MPRKIRFLLGGWYVCLFLLLLGSVALADPLDDAQAKLGGFLQKSGLIMTALLPSGAGVAIAALALKRSAAKAMGEEEGMTRSSNQITEVLKLTAVGTGASLLVAVAGSILA